MPRIFVGHPLTRAGTADLLCCREVGTRIAAAIGDALPEEMRAERGNLTPRSSFLERLADLEPRLVDILTDADEPEPARVAAARALGARRATSASIVLTRVLNEPLPWLRHAAASALEMIPKGQAAHVGGPGLSVVPCSHRWGELMPMDPVDGRQQRSCADCEKPVQRMTDLAGLAILGQGACGFLDPPLEEAILIDVVGGTWRLRVGQSRLVVGDGTKIVPDMTVASVRFMNAGGEPRLQHARRQPVRRQRAARGGAPRARPLRRDHPRGNHDPIARAAPRGAPRALRSRRRACLV